MTADEYATYVRELVDDWPPLTTEQRARLRPLLKPDVQSQAA